MNKKHRKRADFAKMDNRKKDNRDRPLCQDHPEDRGRFSILLIFTKNRSPSIAQVQHWFGLRNDLPAFQLGTHPGFQAKYVRVRSA